MSTLPSGKLPLPRRAPHVVGCVVFCARAFSIHFSLVGRSLDAIGLPGSAFSFALPPAFIAGIFLSTLPRRQAAAPHSRTSFLWSARFLCPRLRRASRLSPRPSPNAIRVLGTGFLLRPASSPLAAKAPERQKGPPAPHALEALLPPSVSPFPSPGFPPKPVSGPRPPLGAADGTGPGTGPHHIPAWPPPP